MDIVTKVKIINVLTIILISLAASLFLVYSPARKRGNMAVAINYFSLFFVCIAASYLFLAFRQSMDRTLSLVLTNALEVLGIQALRYGFLWRKSVQKHLHTDPWVYGHALVFVFFQVFMFSHIFDSIHLRNLLTASSYIFILAICFRLVPLDSAKRVYGERIMHTGIIIGSALVVYFLVSQYFSTDESDMLAQAILSQVLIVITLFGSLMSLMLSDIIEVFKINSITDSMTGLYNRRHFIERANNAIKDAERSDSKIALIICDVDLFKTINDTYGHDIGDKAICNFSHLIKKSVRENDLVARYGGEEFVVLLFNTDQAGALSLAEKIRSRLESSCTQIGSLESLRFTASFGVCMFTGGMNLDRLIKKADDALYRAKENGKNRVEIIE